MSHEERVHDGVDDRVSLALVPHAEAQVQYQRHVALLGVAGRVRHGALHAAGDRDAATRGIRDLQAEQLGARRHAVEPRHVEQTVSRGDARHVGAVPAVVEEQVEQRRAVGFAEVGGEGDRLGPEGDRLTPVTVVVQRHLVFERAVQVRVEERHPAVARLDDNDRKRVGVGTIAVQVAGGRLAERQLPQHSGVPRRGGGEATDAVCARQRVPAHGDGAVGRGGDGGERDATLPREVAQLDDLGRPGAGGDQAVHARVDAGVEDRDQDAAPVVRRMLNAELIDSRAFQRHEPGHERDRRGQRGLACGHRGGVGRRRRCGGAWRPLRRDGGRAGACRGAAAGGDQDGQGDAAGITGHEALGRTKAPRCGPENSVVASSRKARTSRVSSGGTMASTKPRAPANRASSWRS